MSDFIKMLEQAATAGWDGIDDPHGLVAKGREAIEAKEREELRRQTRILRDCFGTEAGKLALELLRKHTIARPPTQAELDERDPHALALAAARRMGANQLMFQIEAALAAEPGEEEGFTNG